MKIHEYQARQLLADAGIPVPAGAMVQTVEDAVAEAKRIFSSGEKLVVIKAQVHAGGRGKAGFVKLVRSADEATEGRPLHAHQQDGQPQTGPEGLEVNKLLIAAGVDIAKEYYLAITTDRATAAMC
jgi:succinyl-CoA synthetase beta subunit